MRLDTHFAKEWDSTNVNLLRFSLSSHPIPKTELPIPFPQIYFTRCDIQPLLKILLSAKWGHASKSHQLSPQRGGKSRSRNLKPSHQETSPVQPCVPRGESSQPNAMTESEGHQPRAAVPEAGNRKSEAEPWLPDSKLPPLPKNSVNSNVRNILLASPYFPRFYADVLLHYRPNSRAAKILRRLTIKKFARR
jgi:hypothetical protein